MKPQPVNQHIPMQCSSPEMCPQNISSLERQHICAENMGVGSNKFEYSWAKYIDLVLLFLECLLC